ncbi:MAG TPA: sodium:proline symporter, partial [Luteimonas sp.]|nr:sodium:proline symporter [Luteimonas sp.]
MTASTPLLATFAAYLLLMVGIGFWAWRSTRSFDDYILGGRSLGSYVTALSAGASDMSGWLLLGLPGALYLSGVSEAWIAIGLLLGAWANWKFVAGPLRVYTEHASNALTLPDYFTNRFADRRKLLRVIAALVILVFFAVYCASGIVAGARLFESVFGMP